MKAKSWLDLLPAPDPNMSKRSMMTHFSPLPADISRRTAIAFLHKHHEMIEMNPLVIRWAESSPPSNATRDETDNMTWYEMTDEIQYIPGTAVKGEVTYKAGFYDLPQGLQTHTFAPGGVDIHGKWTVGGNAPGEEREPLELGLNKPLDGLYIREDVDLRCNVFLANFVKRNLKKSHATVVERLIKKAKEMQRENPSLTRPMSVLSASSDNIVMKRNSFIKSPVPYSQLYVPSGTNLSRDTAPQSNISQISQRVCSCLGTRHHPACRYFIDIYQQAESPSVDSPASDPLRSAPPSRTTTWDATPTNAYPRSDQSNCFCTGGVHLQGCPQYPGLRLSPARSASPNIRDSQQLPYQLSFAASQSRTPSPEDQRAPGNGTNSWPTQRYSGHFDSPADSYSQPFSAQTEGSNSELTPPPLMTRTSMGHAVLTEMEGDSAMARRYYEYQVQRAAETQ